MVIRAQRSADTVQGLFWACRRAPGCTGARRIKSPDAVQPTTYDGSLQAIFEWMRAREYGHVSAPAVRGLRGLFGRTPQPGPADASPQDAWLSPEFQPLVEHGFVVLQNRSLPAARVTLDNVVVGPSGVFVVERKTWPGQISTTSDSIYVDGRERPTVTDNVQRATAALEQTLAHELKPVGAPVHAALLFEQAANRSFETTVGKVLVGGARGLLKGMRGTAEPVMGPETVVRLALAADRLLE